MQFKKYLLGDLALDIKQIENHGYKDGVLYTLISRHHPDITKIRNMSIEESLSLIDELGIALWFYDDGSLHKSKLFYNLNTQKYSEEINSNILVPFLKKFNINAKSTIERKKDGKEFWYLRISKFEGAYEISKILSTYKVNCYDYKIWDSETILRWSKLQAKLKNVPVDLLESMTTKMHSSLLNKDLSTEDIVRTLVKARDRLRKRQSSNNKGDSSRISKRT